MNKNANIIILEPTTTITVSLEPEPNGTYPTVVRENATVTAKCVADGYPIRYSMSTTGGTPEVKTGNEIEFKAKRHELNEVQNINCEIENNGVVVDNTKVGYEPVKIIVQYIDQPRITIYSNDSVQEWFDDS